ncbi:Coumarine and phenylpropanoid biosynthesis [Scheffersomyces coipomensis]|uniref:Coumarine and phenylpropanoid biosynthesis n=1 Tax=Scheffersomyces coipomensis TaxID=1788519 RepID=UPI00315CD682
MSEIYLVTGGTGYVGAFTVLELLEQGHKVKTTIRNLGKESQFRESLYESSPKLTKAIVDENLTVLQADLLDDKGWEEAFKDVTYVLHVASPFPSSKPSDPQVLIKPAVEGTLRILKFAAKSPLVKHVVITSSFAAIGFGFPDDRTEPYSEKDWSIVEKTDFSPYIQSKTLAEKSAWDFVKDPANNVKFGLTTINPALIIGASLKGQVTDSTSLLRIKNLVDGTYKDKGIAPSSTHLVNVKDVVKLHLESLTNPKANGERFLTHSGPNLSFYEAAQILKKSNISEDLKKNLPIKELEGSEPLKPCDISKAKSVFNWTPIPNEVSLVETIEGLIADGQL